VDQRCSSACKYCHAVGGGTMCSTDCGSAERRVATQCNCDDVPGYMHFPEGYSASQVSTQFTTLTVVNETAWNAQGWDCGEGPRQLDGLVEGKHEFGARTLDQGLHTSGDPFLHQWTIDATPPVAGFVRFPDPVVSASSVPMWQYHADEDLKGVVCTLGADGVVPCATPSHDASALFPVNVSEYELGDGEQSFTIEATDLAGNPGAKVAVQWMVDNMAPTVELLQVETVGDALLAAAVVEPGATVLCSLAGLATADGASVQLSSCTHPVSPDHCSELAITGTAPPGVVGPYVQRWCPDLSSAPPAEGSGDAGDAGISGSGSSGTMLPAPKVPDVPCMVEGRPVYEHRDSKVLLQYQSGRWALFQNSVAVMSVSTVAVVPTAIPSASAWVGNSINGSVPAAWSVAVECVACVGCGRIAYRNLPGGTYTLCVVGRDEVGNVGNSSCSQPILVVTAEEQQQAIEVAAASSMKACTLPAKEWPIAVATMIAFGLFVVFLSMFVYAKRKAAAIALANAQKTSAILTSTVGFREAQLQTDEMAF
jgi:hypothetical protein